jgi:hypothetical protein
MFCPKCKAEFEENVSRCPECDVELVEELIPDPQMDYVEFESVFKTSHPAMIQIVKSVLEDAEIPYSIKGQGLQSIMALGTIQFQVPSELAGNARELLRDLTNDEDAEIIE